MKTRHQVLAMAAGALLLAGYAGAQTPSTAEPKQTQPGTTSPGAASTPHQREAMTSGNMEHMPSPGSTGGQDPATFVKKAALDGMTEVELGTLAQQTSKNEEVRSFAERMVKDHNEANSALASLAKRKGYDVPKELDAEHQAMISKLSSKSGAAFDAAYADAMDKAHAKAVALFKDAQKSSDRDIAAFAKKTLPTLDEHKQLAASLKPKIKTASAGSDAKE